MMFASRMMCALRHILWQTSHHCGTKWSNIIFAKQMHHIAAGDASLLFVDRFKPPHGRGRRLDDPKNTVQTGCRGRQPLPFKNYLQSRRCNGILDRFEPAKHFSNHLAIFCCANFIKSTNDIYILRLTYAII